MTDKPYIVWFDIDNTLYSAKSGIAHQMGQRIKAYFNRTFPGDEKLAEALHLEYYTKHGLALRGLMLHHDVDPVEFDEQCDQKLSLDSIKPNPELRQLLLDIDRSTTRVWGLTNAYKVHASRVLQKLGIDDLFEGIVYCRYNDPPFVCKPDTEYYEQALKTANVTDPSKCHFIDDNRKNVDTAIELGWKNSVHFCERGLESVEGGQLIIIGNETTKTNGVTEVTDLDQLRDVWPHIFRQVVQ